MKCFKLLSSVFVNVNSCKSHTEKKTLIQIVMLQKNNKRKVDTSKYGFGPHLEN